MTIVRREHGALDRSEIMLRELPVEVEIKTGLQHDNIGELSAQLVATLVITLPTARQLIAELIACYNARQDEEVLLWTTLPRTS